MPFLIDEAAAARPPEISSRLQLAVGSTTDAARIARIWPTPHTGFFKLDVPRRNAIRLAANRGMIQVDGVQDADCWALRRLVTTLIPDAPNGLAEAFRKLGDTELDVSQLNQLVALLSGDGAKVIRHAKELDIAALRILHALPEELRRPRIVSQLEGVGAANLLAAGAKLCLEKGAQLNQLGARLERSRTVQAMFRMLVDEIGLQVLAPPPIPGTSWLVPINTAEKIRETALRFRNCLESRIGWMLKGFAAYYEVRGAEPAVVEIVRHPQFGWRLGEALGHANKPMSRELNQRVRAYLQEQTVSMRDKYYDDVAIRLAAAAGW